MPGPRAFVEQSARYLREGTNLVLRFPERGGEGFWDALDDKSRDYDLWLHPLESNPNGSIPMEVVNRYCQGGQPAEDCWDLAKHEGFHGVVRIEFRESAPAQEWASFLEEFRRATRDRGPGGGVVCLLLEGKGTEVRGPKPEVGLEVLNWEGVSTILDMRCYAAGLVRRPHGTSALEHELRVETIAQLALGDPLLAERLSRCSLDTLKSPCRVLIEYGEEAGWGVAAVATWVRGMEQRVDDRQVTHSSWLAMQRREHELSRRIWRAQATVILPWLEECRAELLEAVRPALPMPWEYERRDGLRRWIEEAEQMELKDLLDFLSTQTTPRLNEARKAVRQLVDWRNRLSHFSNEGAFASGWVPLSGLETEVAAAVAACRQWAKPKALVAGRNREIGLSLSTVERSGGELRQAG